MLRRSERGFTLTELTIVTVLATLVMAGLVGFYLSSQATWMEGSAQAITQREASALLKSMTDHVHAAGQAALLNPGDPLHQGIALFDPTGNPPELYRFLWKSADSLVHEGAPGQPLNSSASSKVTRFTFDVGQDHVDLVLLEMVSTQGDTVRLSSSMTLYNRPPS